MAREQRKRAETGTDAHLRRRRACARAVPSAAIALAGALALAACTSFKDLDPRDSLMKHVGQAIPGTDQPYPNLASVPDGAPNATPKGTRVELQKKLAADNKATSYQPDKASAPPMPAAPAALPQGFLTTEQPMLLPGSVPQAQQSQSAVPKGPAGSKEPTPPQLAAAPRSAAARSAPALGLETGPETTAGLPAGRPAFGALGRPRRLAVVLFDGGSSAIDANQVARLKPLVDALRRQGGALQVVGYAASADVGQEAARAKLDNLNLSLDRANAVARALQGLGVQSTELIVSAEGDNAPAAAIGGVRGGAANERADIYIEN